MINGILVINLDPPYAGFSGEDGHSRKNCTVDELTALLADLGGLVPGQSWPPREFVLRVSGRFSRDALHRFGLVKLASMPAIMTIKRASKRLSAS